MIEICYIIEEPALADAAFRTEQPMVATPRYVWRSFNEASDYALDRRDFAQPYRVVISETDITQSDGPQLDQPQECLTRAVPLLPLTLIEQLDFKVKLLACYGAYHIKRGFKLSDAAITTITNHLLEEVVELQAEAIHGTPERQLFEAADVLAVFMHLLHNTNLSLDDVLSRVLLNLDKSFTFDQSKVNTKTPGFNRSNR